MLQKKWYLVGKIGEGKYGVVYKACEGKEVKGDPYFLVVQNPPFYAIKTIKSGEEIMATHQPASAAVVVGTNPSGAASAAATATTTTTTTTTATSSSGIAKGTGISALLTQNVKKPYHKTIYPLSTLREIKLLREMNHPNVVTLRDVLTDFKAREISLVFDYATWDMHDIIDHHRNIQTPIPEFTVKSMIYQCLQGLKYIHENWIVHRDLKPQNILILNDAKGENSRVQIGDFGLARFYREPIRALGAVDKVVVTVWYRSPELLLGSLQHTPALDIWSMGCIIADLWLAHNTTCRALFEGVETRAVDGESGPKFQSDQCDKIFKVLGFPTAKQWPECSSLPKYPKISDWPKKHQYPTESILREKVPIILDSTIQSISTGSGRQAPQQQQQQQLQSYTQQVVHTPAREAAYDLLTRMLDLNPDTRISATEALEHPYFKNHQPLPSSERCFIESSSTQYIIKPPKPIDAGHAKAQNLECIALANFIRLRQERERFRFHRNARLNKHHRIDETQNSMS